MGRTAALTLGLLLALTACGAESAADDGGATSSTPTTSASITTTTTVAATSTTTTADPCEGEPFSIDQRGGRLIPGCLHRTDDFGPTPILFTTGDDRWLTFADGDPRLVLVGIDVDGDGGSDAALAFVVWNSDLNAADILAELDTIEGVDQETSPDETTIAGVPALVTTFVASDDPLLLAGQPCTTTGLRFTSDAPGFQLITFGDRQDVGFPACNRTQVWAVAWSPEETFLILAAANDPDRFEELSTTIGDFLANSVTFGDGDG